VIGYMASAGSCPLRASSRGLWVPGPSGDTGAVRPGVVSGWAGYMRLGTGHAREVHAHDKNVFDRRVRLGEIFAVQNAQVLAHIQQLAAELQAALHNRGLIDRAIGILMSQVGCTEGEATARLRALRQNEQQLEVVAERIVDDAVRRLRGGYRDG
jgi:polyhydroxyalkanoate synthesis regulator phasin